MLYRKITDVVTPESAVTTSGTGAQKLRFRVKQEDLRVEQMTLKFRFTTAASAITGALYAGLVSPIREVRVVVDDILGKRNCVQMAGMALMMFTQQNFINLDGQTQIGYASTGIPVSTTLEVSVVIPIRHPSFAEPFGNQLSLPVSGKFTNTDTWVEVDLADFTAAAGCFTTNPPTLHATDSVLLEVIYRQVPESVPYIPSELVSDLRGFTSTSNAYYEIPSGGYLTQLGVQGLSADYDDTTTRVALISAGNRYKLELGRVQLANTNQEFVQSLNDKSRVVYPRAGLAVTAEAVAATTGSRLHYRNFDGEAFFDFLSDSAGFDTFSVNSVLALDTAVTGGNKLKLTFNDLASANYKALIHYHKLLPKNVADLSGLAAGI
jgi:hypothetical protein